MDKPKVIHLRLGFARLSDADLLSRLTSVHDSMAGNAAFPNPPVDPGVFKAALDAFSAAIAEALDGGKKRPSPSVTFAGRSRHGFQRFGQSHGDLAGERPVSF